MTPMTLPETAIAMAALLLTPGPTNTLVALAGAERGFLRALRLIPVELAAYLAAVVPLALAGPLIVDRVPGAATVVTASAALWVGILAVRLWRLPAPGAASAVTAGRVALTTFLNPKALVFGLVILPGGSLAPRLALFALLVGLVAALWAAIGAGALGPFARGALLRRGAAVWLAALSALLAARALAG
jgi:threonine/homoserine/homoserine lactone efflux protein